MYFSGLAVAFPSLSLGMLYEPDLELVVKELSPVNKKWRLIGEEIIGVVRVYDIKYSDTTDCLRELFKRKLQYTNTWKRIIAALRRVDESSLADRLQAKYYPGQLTSKSSCLLKSECIADVAVSRKKAHGRSTLQVL